MQQASPTEVQTAVQASVVAQAPSTDLSSQPEKGQDEQRSQPQADNAAPQEVGEENPSADFSARASANEAARPKKDSPAPVADRDSVAPDAEISEIDGKIPAFSESNATPSPTTLSATTPAHVAHANTRTVAVSEKLQPLQADAKQVGAAETTSAATVAANTELTEALAKVRAAFEPAAAPQRVSNPTIPAMSSVAALLTQNLIHGIAQGAGSGAASSASEHAIRSASAPGTTATNNMMTAVGNTSPLRNPGSSEARASRSLPPAVASRAFERVEQTLKEVARSKDGKSISLLLNPSELGQVKVDVTLREGTLHARLAAENPQVAQLLRERAQDLQVMLRKLGLDVDNISVAVQGDGQSFGQLNENLGGKNWQGSGENGRTLSGGSLGSSVISHGGSEAVQSSSSTLDHWVA
jgi:flagellar hook-length control protein FliK